MNLTEHFTLAEFSSPDGRPTPQRHIYWLRLLCVEYLEPLRDAFGPVHVTSGHRSAAHNSKVGGAPRSFHLRRNRRAGAAADVWCERGSPSEWAEFLEDRGCPGVGRYIDHVHADNRAGRARW